MKYLLSLVLVALSVTPSLAWTRVVRTRAILPRNRATIVLSNSHQLRQTIISHQPRQTIILPQHQSPQLLILP